MLIGVHTGEAYSPEEVLNQGTLITREIYDWIQRQVKRLAEIARKDQP